MNRQPFCGPLPSTGQGFHLFRPCTGGRLPSPATGLAGWSMQSRKTTAAAASLGGDGKAQRARGARMSVLAMSMLAMSMLAMRMPPVRVGVLAMRARSMGVGGMCMGGMSVRGMGVRGLPVLSVQVRGLSRRLCRNGALQRAGRAGARVHVVQQFANGARAAPALGTAAETPVHLPHRADRRLRLRHRAADLAIGKHIAGTDDHRGAKP